MIARHCLERHRRWHAAAAVAIATTVLALAGCGGGDGGSSTSGRAIAQRATSRSELVGGERALGEPGDIIMKNEKIRLVIQKEGFSRGFGVYGGGLIDADLRRPREEGTNIEALGNDQFAELFPAFFVQAVKVDSVEIVDDGADGGPARVEASGKAGDFLELAGVLNRAVTGSNQSYRNAKSDPRIGYSTIYELEPDKQYVTIRFRVKNIGTAAMSYPGRDARTLFSLIGLPLQGFTVPSGDIALFGATSKVFIPGIGFDLRFGLERAYQRDIDFPAFPGFVGEFIASRGENASYGYVVDPGGCGVKDKPECAQTTCTYSLAGNKCDWDENCCSLCNYAYEKRGIYADERHTPITSSSLLVPFVASSFVGVFHNEAPPCLKPEESFEIVKRFVVGSGDVGSVLDVINEIRGETVGRLAGELYDSSTGEPLPDLSVVVYQRFSDGQRRVYSQYDTREKGIFGGSLAVGSYSLKIVGGNRPATDFTDFEITAGKTTPLILESHPAGRIFVNIYDDHGNRLPAKATAVGRYAAEDSGRLTPEFLFDLEAGESFLSTDLVPDDANNPDTREFIEAVGFTEDGVAELRVRPGEYDIVSSRGPEYDTATTRVSVRSGQAATVQHRLSRVVDTTGWMALDSHIHSRKSIDSDMDLDERVRALAAEGIEIAVSTDHNYVTDYGPYVGRNNLHPWLRSIVGLEMTTLESGHFNGFPLRYQVGPITHGSFEWARRRPDQIFEDIRNLGLNGPQNTIVQVNHPRDSILGYYTQYGRDPLTTAQIPSTFIDQFINPTGPAFRKHACGFSPDKTCTTSNDCPAGTSCLMVNNKLKCEFRPEIACAEEADCPLGNVACGFLPARACSTDDDCTSGTSCLAINGGRTCAFRTEKFCASQVDCPMGTMCIDTRTQCLDSGETTFSFDYDAVELLNGKLYYEVRHYRVPEELPPGNLPSPLPPTGTILRGADNSLAFPGVIDDWFNTLNLGYRFVGVGTGDSHSGFDEPGQFRTMVYVGTDSTHSVTEQMLVDALRSRRAVATNGPLIDFWIDDPELGVMGQTIVTGDSKVDLTYRITAAPWMSLERVNIYRNGVIAWHQEIDPDRDLAAQPLEETISLDLATDTAGNPIDSWFVVDATGYRSMHPVIRTVEVPPVLLTDALASLAGPLGLANDEFGDLRPPEVYPVTPYAITNPVWVKTHPEGLFHPPGVVPFAVQNLPENDPKWQAGIYAASTVSRPQRVVDARSRVARVHTGGRRNVPLFYPFSDDIEDVRKVMGRLGALGRHGPH